MKLNAIFTITTTALLLTGCGKFSYTVKVSKQDIQAKMDKMFPVDLQKEAELPFPAMLSAGEVVLDESSDQIGMKISFSADPPALPAPKPAAPSGGPPRPPFAPPGAPALSNPPPAGEPIEGVVSVAGDVSYDSVTGGFYFKNPTVRQFEAGEMPEALSGKLSKAVEKIAGEYLQSHAIHTLDGDELSAKAARALLKSVQVRDGELRVTIGF
jgi:hypothetical protein